MIRRFIPLCLLILIVSCNKNDSFTPASATQYYPVEVGQYIDYDLDSTVFLEFGTEQVVKHYLAREVVEGTLVDNMGRNSFRVVRYMRQQPDAPWATSFTYMITPLKNSVEVMENNLRYVKLVTPVRQDYSWFGNQYIDTYSTDLDLSYLDGWEFTYDSVGAALSYGSLNFANTVKVFESDDFFGQDPSIPGTQYGERNFAYEKYAAGVGLIERNFLHWEYQAQPGKPYYYVGYGIKMTITGYGKN